MPTSNVFEELTWRGLVYDFSAGAEELLKTEKVTVYNGFDVTADSLHVGHMVPLMALARLQRFGHHPIALAGGGTTMVGDPSGKSSERQLLSREEIEANAESIELQLAHFLDFESKSNPARLMNNADWLLSLNLVEFLRDIGKHFTVNTMLTKDSVKTRLEKESGLSFTEFSYMLLQSYDFLHLNIHEGCMLQTGGSDQWGNITAGAELVRRVRGQPAYALVYPLIVKSDGTKFGKTEAGAVWLSEKRTSPFRFYQFWLNTDDRDVIHYLKFFTWLDQQKVVELEGSVVSAPEQRLAQRTLAEEMTLMLHGQDALERARQASQVLFGGEIGGLTRAEIQDIFADVPSSEIAGSQLEGQGAPVVDLLEKSGVAKSRGEARRLIGEGGIYLNNRRVNETARAVTLDDVIDGQFLLLRRGAKNYHLLKILR